MTQSKKAIGFFVSLAFLALGYLLFVTKQMAPFSDFALLEWQIKLASQGTFHLNYEYLLLDPQFEFFPLPDIFFHVHEGIAYSTFPNLYPILFSFVYMGLGTIGIKLAQFCLFFLSIFIFHSIKKDVVSTILLLFGSTISIYIFLIHETILFLLLEVLILYLYNRKWTAVSGVLSICLVWMRPEMIFAIGFLPFCFSKEQNWKRFFLAFLITGIVFSITNQIALGTFLPLRMVKNSEFHFRPEMSFYLFKIWIEQVPLFILFIFIFLRSVIRKELYYPNLILLLITMVMILISPNTGGHNTPRYLFGLIPLYILSLRNKENSLTQVSKLWFLTILFLSFYSITILFQQTKELKKISKFQTNTLEEISKLEDSLLIFNNSDFVFVTLPLLEEKKDLLLLRANFNHKKFSQILNVKNAKSFTFLELPPSPVPLDQWITTTNKTTLGSFRKVNQSPLPNALLPIQATKYLREFPETSK